MDWKAVLADLRAHLPPGGGGQARGSLRWLETQMRGSGASPSSVRNIIYRDIGTPADRAALRAILTELARETGRPLPDSPDPAAPPPVPDELDLLGRSKKRAYRQFLAGVRAGRAPKLIVCGRAGAGKTVLLSHVARTLAAQGVPVRQLFLSGEAAGTLQAPAPAGSSFAALAQAQLDAARQVLPVSGTLLVRVTHDLTLHGSPPRLPGGQPVDPATWAVKTLLERVPAGVSVLLAVEGDAPADAPCEVIELRPPTTAEAREYLMTRLGVPRAEAERLVRETGRHLDRLTLLASLSGDDVSPADLLGDPDSRRVTEATAALHAAGWPALTPWPDALLGTLLGGPPTALPPHARALLRGSAELGWQPAPVLSAAWPAVARAAQAPFLRALAAAPAATGLHRLAALAALNDWTALAAHVSAHPDDIRHLPPLWPALRAAPTGPDRETLARAVVTHHAGRGEYNEPRARDALFTLMESSRDPVRAWARVKLAESSLESGNMDAARTQLDHPDVTGMTAQMAGLDPWTVAAQADALLVQAALARWQGDLETATRAASDPRAAHGGPRALLWRGLIAKDAGRWPEALAALRAVPDSSPLLSARARYQQGDLHLRLGQPAAALDALLDAARRMEAAGGSAEEVSRILARTATALRRLGRADDAWTQLKGALDLVPADERRHVDGVPRARLLSEGVPILLALGRHDDALAQAVRALDLLRRSDARPAEARYRERRTRYRVALAYLSRGLGRPYLQPLRGPSRDHPDLAQARAILDDLLNPALPLPGTAPRGDRESILHFDMLLSRALAEPDGAAALRLTGRALDMAAHAYEEAQARAMCAEVQLRGPDTQGGAALADLNRAHALLRRVHSGLGGTHTPDPGLHAQLLALEARASILEGASTLHWLAEELRAPALAAFRGGVWREAAQALEALHPDPAAVLRDLGVPFQAGLTRVSDALRLHHADPA
ncbi:hypothetical protein M8445_13355 [Deinococcus aquaticus]|uniref:Tetratricopeptide repeat protein n=1 Tax=Deinococcus aquaticus TaxID=328692 RepID=A0ABY7UZH4_9DEIO|nr:hypothetical protein [Deinococcus aquaticus]WDA58321.1 hypothetical protein M8445_13355 [Deinococcus aquaticus]